METAGGVRKGFPVAAASTAEWPGSYPADVDASETLPPELERFWRIDDGLTAIQRAEAYGIDLSLFDENPRLTPAERLRQNDIILNETEALARSYTRQLENLDSVTVLVLTLAALIHAKRAMGRPQSRSAW